MTISSQAAQAREAARHQDGRFGETAHGEPVFDPRGLSAFYDGVRHDGRDNVLQPDGTMSWGSIWDGQDYVCNCWRSGDAGNPADEHSGRCEALEARTCNLRLGDTILAGGRPWVVEKFGDSADCEVDGRRSAGCFEIKFRNPAYGGVELVRRHGDSTWVAYCSAAGVGSKHHFDPRSSKRTSSIAQQMWEAVADGSRRGVVSNRVGSCPVSGRHYAGDAAVEAVDLLEPGDSFEAGPRDAITDRPIRFEVVGVQDRVLRVRQPDGAEYEVSKARLYGQFVTPFYTHEVVQAWTKMTCPDF